MEKLTLPGTDLHVSRLALGTGDWGSTRPIADAGKLFEAYLAAGGNLFDSAHCYAFWLPNGDGMSERTLGQLVRQHGVRKDVIISTKGGHCDAGSGYPRPSQCLRRDLVERDIQQSLERLGLPQVDLYYLHRDDGITPVEEVMETLNNLVHRGWVRYIAASNWSTHRMDQANAVAAERGWQCFCASQVQWSLATPNRLIGEDPVNRHITPTDRAWHLANKMPVVAYTATAGGLFSRTINGGDFDTPENRGRHERVQQLAATLGHTPTQLALAWLTNQSIPVVALTGTANVDHLNQSMAALSIHLTPTQLQWLESGGLRVEA